MCARECRSFQTARQCSVDCPAATNTHSSARHYAGPSSDTSRSGRPHAADGHAQFATLLPQRIHTRVIGMHPRSFGLARNQSLPLVVDLPYSTRSCLFATLQLLDGGGAKPGLVVARKVKPAPHFESLG